MVQIAKLTCVNWGALPTAEFPLGPVTLLTGGSGTGKTTMADAIQSVLTAVKRNLYTFNPSQDETTQHGRHGKTPRTLASYVLGCDDNVYARPNGAYGYVSVVFAPSPGESGGQVFSAILGVRAYLETVELAGGRRRRTAREEEVKLLIVEGHGVGLNDLLEAADGRDQRAVSTESVLTVLRQRYGDNAVTDFGDNKRNYLCKLYGLLRGRSSVSADEAEKAARTFSRFMAYKPIDSVHQFVRDQILEPRDMGEQINTIAGLMRRMYEFRTESERLARNVEILSHAEREGTAVRASWREACETRVCAWFKASHDAQAGLHKANEEIRALNAEQAQLRRRQKELDQLLNARRSELNDVEASLRQSRPFLERKSLNEKIEAQVSAAARAIGELQQALGVSSKNFEVAQQLKHLPSRLRQQEPLSGSISQTELAAQSLRLHDIATVGALMNEIARTAGDPPVDLLERLADAVSGLDEEHEFFVSVVNEPDKGLRAQAEQVYALVSAEIKKIDNEKGELQKVIDDLGRGGRVRYPPDVEAALHAIRQDLPGADPLVLCDLLEIKDKEWQPAVEAYMGHNRFVIIVKPEFEARAIRCVRTMRRSGAKVVQGTRASRDAPHLSVPADSIIHLFDVRHPIARVYLTAVYGLVVRVKDTEQLRHTPRGVTQDGQGSAGYTMFPCMLDNDQLVIGKSGREAQLKAKIKKLNETQLVRDGLETYRGDVDHIRRLCQAVEVAQVERHVADALAAARLIAVVREQIEQLELTQEEKALNARCQLLKDHISKHEAEKGDKQKRDGAIDERRTALDTAIADLKKSHTEAEQKAKIAIEDLQRLTETEMDYDASETIVRLRAEAAGAVLTDTDNQKSLHGVRTALGKFLRYVSNYNQQARQDEQIKYQPILDMESFSGWNEYLPFAEAYQQVRVQLFRQRENRLSEVTGQLRDAERNVRSAFTAQFCQLVHDAVLSGYRYLRSLNDSLRRHHFSEETYRFTSEWVPDFQRYFDFFEAVVQSEQVDEEEDLFASKKLTDQQAAVRAELVALLLGNEEQRAHNKLLEIADYRNYRHYDILRDTGHGDPTPLSEWGQGSGGQLQTAAYVVRGAALSSAFRHAEGECHFRTVLLDESFSTMDERRTKEVVALLSQTMGFQVIFIVPTRACGPFMPLATNKLVFSKVRSAAASGELKTVTYIDQQIVNLEEVARLFEVQRQRVRAQVLESFRQKRAHERGLA